jgi:cytochrome b561
MTRSDQGYSRTVLVLHWFLALSIFFLFISSWWMLGLPLASENYRFREIPFQLHKNVGMTLVAAILVMIYVRFRRRPQPELSEILPSRMSKLATIDHVILYALIFACCLSGYLSSSYSGWGTQLWWLVDLPNWGYENEELNILYSDIHLWTCWLLLGVVAVHISGALYHAFRNDGVIRRMLHL